MSLPLEAAADSLEQVALQNDVTSRLSSRLEVARVTLGTELGQIEDQLRRIAQDGPKPGSDAAQHLVTLGGKRVRPMTLLLSSACVGEISEQARQLAVVVELVHSATLLHDDVIDDGAERRGAPSARTVWGNAVSVLGGDLMLVHALQVAQRFAPTVMPRLVDTLRTLVEGEIVQLRGRSTLDVSELTYQTILRDKTASLFRFSAWAGGRVAGADERQQEILAEFGECVGFAFQLIDDALDYSSRETGKTLCADLREGKLTLPLVLAAKRYPELLAALRRIHAGSDEEVEYVRERILACGACDDVRARARVHTQRAIDLLAELPLSSARDLLESVAQQLSARTR